VELILVRHGRPERDDNSSDPALNDLGHRQAQAVSQYLQGEQIDHVLSSSMVRARQTAEPLAEALGIDLVQRDDLREVDDHRDQYIPGEELTPESHFVKAFLEDPHFLFADHGGWEPWKARITATFDDIIETHRGQRVAVFCHGVVMATFFCTVMGTEDAFAVSVDYTSIARAKGNSDGLRSIQSWNETAHVREMLT
jgi:probable phosphoglycerate mutase